MIKKRFLWPVCWLLTASIWSSSASWSQRLNRSQLEEKLREAEKNYSEKNYSEAEDIFLSLSESFPTDSRFSYFQLMIAKCQYHLKDYISAQEKFKNFIHQFPQSSFVPTCYFMLGNVAFLQGETFEAAQEFIYAYDWARGEHLRDLARRSLVPLLEKWLSPSEIEELSKTSKDRKLAPLIFFWSGKRNLERKNYAEAFKALNYYRDNFPHGENIGEVDLLLRKPYHWTDKTIKVGVLVPLTGALSLYGNNLLNGIRLALSSYPSAQGKVELKVRDTEGDFVKTAQLCRELMELENIACVIGPLRSESVVGAAVMANTYQIPLITPTASKEGLASLGDYVFQLSPSPQRKGRSLAEFVVQEQGLEDFAMLIPDDQSGAPEALSFKETVVKLGSKILAVEHYPAGTKSFSPYLRGIKNKLLGLDDSSILEEEDSFFDQVPVWVDGLFISAGPNQIYDILSQIINLNLYSTIIGTEGWGEQPVVEFTQNLDRDIIFTWGSLPQNSPHQRQHILELYREQYKKEPDQISLLGYDSMELLLSVLEDSVSPEELKDALLNISNFKGAAGEIRFDSEGANINIPIYKLEKGLASRLR